MLTLIEKENSIPHNKIAKPNFDTKPGREFLSYYLQAKFKQLLLHDKKSQTPIFKEIRNNIISKFAKRLILEPQKKILIGITGESASGKTTICDKLRELINVYDMPIEILSADNYFNDISHLISKYENFDNLRDSGYDVDAPENFQLDLLYTDLQKLSAGQDIKAPKYLINGTGISLPEEIEIKSQKIIIVEGLSTMYNEIPNIFDIKIFVDVDKIEQKKQFLKRAKSRNQTKENGLKHWNYVCEAAKKYVQPYKEQADVIINGYADIEYYAQLFSYIYQITNSFEIG